MFRKYGDYLKKKKVGSCLRKHGIHLFAYQPDVFTETGLLASNYIMVAAVTGIRILNA